eukprot:2255379-Rhodomonas_salina.1
MCIRDRGGRGRGSQTASAPVLPEYRNSTLISHTARSLLSVPKSQGAIRRRGVGQLRSEVDDEKDAHNPARHTLSQYRPICYLSTAPCASSVLLSCMRLYDTL